MISFLHQRNMSLVLTHITRHTHPQCVYTQKYIHLYSRTRKSLSHTYTHIHLHKQMHTFTQQQRKIIHIQTHTHIPIWQATHPHSLDEDSGRGRQATVRQATDGWVFPEWEMASHVSPSAITQKRHYQIDSNDCITERLHIGPSILTFCQEVQLEHMENHPPLQSRINYDHSGPGIYFDSFIHSEKESNRKTGIQ